MDKLNLLLFRCSRCCAAFVVMSDVEEFAGRQVVALLEANTCTACGKGEVEFVGKVEVAP